MEVIKDKKSLSAFKVIEGDSVILSAKGIKWYKSDLSYEHSDCKCEVIKANFWGYPMDQKLQYLQVAMFLQLLKMEINLHQNMPKTMPQRT